MAWRNKKPKDTTRLKKGIEKKVKTIKVIEMARRRRRSRGKQPKTFFGIFLVVPKRKSFEKEVKERKRKLKSEKFRKKLIKLKRKERKIERERTKEKVEKVKGGIRKFDFALFKAREALKRKPKSIFD